MEDLRTHASLRVVGYPGLSFDSRTDYPTGLSLFWQSDPHRFTSYPLAGDMGLMGLQTVLMALHALGVLLLEASEEHG